MARPTPTGYALFLCDVASVYLSTFHSNNLENNHAYFMHNIAHVIFCFRA